MNEWKTKRGGMIFGEKGKKKKRKNMGVTMKHGVGGNNKMKEKSREKILREIQKRGLGEEKERIRARMKRGEKRG